MRGGTRKKKERKRDKEKEREREGEKKREKERESDLSNTPETPNFSKCVHFYICLSCVPPPPNSPRPTPQPIAQRPDKKF